MKLQALLVKKIAAFDRALDNKPLKVAVVHHKDGGENVGEVLAAFNAVGVPAVSMNAADFKADGLDVTAAFVLSGALTPNVLAEAEKLQLLTISSTLQPVLDGKVAMAFTLRDDGKPQIVVHLARSKQQGRALTADFLNLARIIR